MAQHLAAAGWLCGSRRHIAGPGDILAIHLEYAPLLVEVKTTARNPYERFGPYERVELRRAARKCGATPLLAWRPPRAKEWTFLGVEDWPTGRKPRP